MNPPVTRDDIPAVFAASNRAIWPLWIVACGLGLAAATVVLMRFGFGALAPCLTAIFTLGIRMIAMGRQVVWMSIFPGTWSLLGRAAAILEGAASHNRGGRGSARSLSP